MKFQSKRKYRSKDIDIGTKGDKSIFSLQPRAVKLDFSAMLEVIAEICLIMNTCWSELSIYAIGEFYQQINNFSMHILCFCYRIQKFRIFHQVDQEHGFISEKHVHNFFFSCSYKSERDAN